MPEKQKVDIAIIGGGIGGIMAAHRLTENDPSLSVVLLEKGHQIEKRVCPIVSANRQMHQMRLLRDYGGHGGRGRLFRRQIRDLDRIWRLADRFSRARNGVSATSSRLTTSWSPTARRPSASSRTTS
ncbi:MAG: NAD(P)-binding protein [Oscillospiraceae bacterium]